MENKIYLGDLKCYIEASEEQKKHPLMQPNRCFDLEKLSNEEVRKEMEIFIRWRGTRLSPLSIRSDIYPFNQLCSCLSDQLPQLKTFVGADLEKFEKKCKTWLMLNGKNLTQKRTRTETGKEQVSDAELIKYVRKIVSFFNNEEKIFNFNANIWYLKNIPIMLRINPTRRVKSINFQKISQEMIREEVKQILYIHLAQKALGTVLAELTAINRFSKYLEENYSEIESLVDIDREVIENYLIYTNTEATGRKSYSKELEHLKATFRSAANVLEEPQLAQLFYKDDIGKQPISVYKVYSDSELVRLNREIVNMDEQVARALIIHQMLGTRISETLTLTQNAVKKGITGQWLIRINQIKSKRNYEKVINEDVKLLFDKACRYTNEKYGVQKYVFVDEKNPREPMQYGQMQYQIMAMVTKKQLVDDHGEKFGVGTHIFRHCYGKKLTEMHVDDLTIAKLLGHLNTSSVKNYRRVSNALLSKETKGMRKDMDEIMKKIISEWN